MEVFDGHRALFRPLARAAIAIGNFDGVHLGHQELLRRAKRHADSVDGDAVVFTFEPHPAAYFIPDRAPPRLSTPARKQELLSQAGMNVVIAEPFDEAFSQTQPDAFTKGILHDVLHASYVVVGHDFTYGLKRQGTVETLREAGERCGFLVDVVDAVELSGERVSSSAIRTALIRGELETANRLLGRAYDVDGPVVRGAGRGRQLGIPTANVDPQGTLLPKPGIYATWVEILGEPGRYMAATSLGTNPTFVEGGALTLEPHILDFDRDLYNSTLRVSFVERLRDEAPFEGVDALLQQIHRDIEQTRKILGD